MNIKQKIKYSVSYNKDSDTLSEKLNVLLNNIVNLIKTNHPSLKETSRIAYGSEQMTDAPLYDGNGRLDYTSNHYESDVVFLGLNKNNLVLSIGFYNGRLVIAMNMDPYVESLYMDIWDTIHGANTFKCYATAKASRWVTVGDRNVYNTSIPYIIINNVIEMSVVYWNGANSSGYMFYNGNRETNDVDLVIYKTYEDGNYQSIGCALYRYSKIQYNYSYPSIVLTFSFNENLSNNMITDHILPYISYPYTWRASVIKSTPVSTIEANGKYDMREWFTTDDRSDNRYNKYLITNMEKVHTLGLLNGCDPTPDNGGGNYSDLSVIYTSSNNPNVMPVYDTVETATPNYSNYDQYHISALCTAYNLPYLNNDNEIYLRQVRIPGFIKNCTGELYLMWTPSKESYKSGDIIEVDGNNYAVINKGVVCWAVKV